MLAVVAANSATIRVVRWINNPGSAAMAAMPNQPVPGNKTPAEANGDAHPTMHRGGTAERTAVAVAANGLRAGCLVQTMTHGNASSAPAMNHREMASTSFEGQYTSDAAITGRDAAP
jgi:hypothetical protein